MTRDKTRIGISMTVTQAQALNHVLQKLDAGGDVRVLMRSQEFREARAVIARAAARTRREQEQVA